MAGDVPHLTYVNAAQSQAIDDELMGERGFSIDCLMELAGLSVACAVQKQYTPCKLCIVCGPGNNGGDGLVAARHLCHFGFTVTIVYPKATTKELYLNLLNQCRDLAIPVLEQLPDLQTAGFELLMDAIFGFSFKGMTCTAAGLCPCACPTLLPRAPCLTCLTRIAALHSKGRSLSTGGRVHTMSNPDLGQPPCGIGIK